MIASFQYNPVCASSSVCFSANGCEFPVDKVNYVFEIYTPKKANKIITKFMLALAEFLHSCEIKDGFDS